MTLKKVDYVINKTDLHMIINDSDIPKDVKKQIQKIFLNLK